jgi:C4-dicarboxylate transporter DctQ subunit
MTDQVPMLGMFRWLEDAINYGDSYDKLPRVIPYVILPFSSALLLLRVVQATIGLLRGERESLIVSHEAEDAVEHAREREWEE